MMWKRFLIVMVIIIVCGIVVVDLVVVNHHFAKAAKAERRGFTTRTFRDAAGHSHAYSIFVPHSYQNGDHPPLIMFLNDTGENGIDGVTQLSNNCGLQIWETKARFPFICLAPQCVFEGSWIIDSLDSQLAMTIPDEVTEQYGVDRDRVYLTGVSAGGSGVWQFAMATPTRFAAIVPVAASGGASVDLASETLPSTHLPVRMFYNLGDRSSLVHFNQRMKQACLDSGHSPLVTAYDLPGHNSWEYGYRTGPLYSWLLHQNRKQNAAQQTRFKMMLSDEEFGSWEQVEDAVWTMDDNSQLIIKNFSDQSDGPRPGRATIFSISSKVIKVGFSLAFGETIPALGNGLETSLRCSAHFQAPLNEVTSLRMVVRLTDRPRMPGSSLRALTYF